MTKDRLKELLHQALSELTPEQINLLSSGIENEDLSDHCNCAAKFILNEAGYEEYAVKQRRELKTVQRDFHSYYNELSFRGPSSGGPAVATAVRVLDEAQAKIPPLWVIESAFEGWFHTMEVEESRGVLVTTLEEHH